MREGGGEALPQQRRANETRTHLRFAAPAFSGCCAGCLERVVTVDTLAMFSSSARPSAGPEPARSMPSSLALLLCPLCFRALVRADRGVGGSREANGAVRADVFSRVWAFVWVKKRRTKL